MIYDDRVVLCWGMHEVKLPVKKIVLLIQVVVLRKQFHKNQVGLIVMEIKMGIIVIIQVPIHEIVRVIHEKAPIVMIPTQASIHEMRKYVMMG